MDKKSDQRGDIIGRFDGLYRREQHAWGVEPSIGVAASRPFLVPGRVLDLGSGDGRNVLYLAHEGFSVTGVDIAPAAIASLKQYAVRANLGDKATGIIADIEGFQIEGQFENIISTFTLHFLPSDAFLPVVTRIMEATTPGGVNVIEDFTRDGPLYKPDVTGHFLESGELEQLYAAQGWQVLYYHEKIVKTKARDENGNPLQQTSAAIVAKKPAL
ncbi:MAG: methyltransferase domain-containing protein [Chloroflexota bacterium]